MDSCPLEDGSIKKVNTGSEQGMPNNLSTLSPSTEFQMEEMSESHGKTYSVKSLREILNLPCDK